MKGKFGIKKGSKEELEFVMYCLIIMCVSCLLFVFFRNLDLCYDLGKDDTDGLIAKLLPENVTLLAMAVCTHLSDVAQRAERVGLYQTEFRLDYDYWDSAGMQRHLANDIQCLFVRYEGWEYHSDDLSVVGCILPFHRLPVQGRHTDEGRTGFDYLK